MPGAGKSFLGRKLSAFFNIAFYDTDDIVEKRVGKEIKDIFSEYGETHFRKLESDALDYCLSLEGDFICSTGGGILENPSNLEKLKGQNTVYIRKGFEDLLQDVGKHKGKRPLLSGNREEKLRELLVRRGPLFDVFPAIEIPSHVFEARDLPFIIYRIHKYYRDFIRTEQTMLEGVHTIQFAPLNVLEIIENRAENVFLSDSVDILYGKMIGKANRFVLPDGEAAKTSDSLNDSWNYLIERGITRGDTLFGFGGGTVTDLTGFVASTFKRGIGFEFIPSTLLAQVDASIGGKNAINIGGVKNVCGTFSFPENVCIDPLISLSTGELELKNGVVEGLKVALIVHADEVILTNQLERAKKIITHPTFDALNNFVLQAVKDKMRIVNDDPYEKGIRKYLNLGHTYGHVFETTYHISHGEAVALGMIKKLGNSRNEIIREYVNFFRTLFTEDLNVLKREWTDRMTQKLFNDKKNTRDSVVFINLNEPGKAFIETVNKETF